MTTPSHNTAQRKHYRLALLGFGNVGKALAELLIEKENQYALEEGITWDVVGIATGSHGIALDPGGLDLEDVLAGVRDGISLEAFSTRKIHDSMDFLRRVPGDVLFESTPVNYQTGQPAVTFLEASLERGMHTITANKGPVVHAFQQLRALAEEKGCHFYFESAVMDGAPIFSLFREALPGARLLGFEGILNSTTNLILERMEEGETFDDAVTYTQRAGLAETDPSGDVDGWDAAVKVAALSTVLMGKPLKPDQVKRTGIRGLTHTDIQSAKLEGLRWKLICGARVVDQEIEAIVAPRKVDPDSPFYHVTGASSVIQFESDVLGKFTLVEEDPTPLTTAYGMMADFLHAVKSS